LLAALAIMAAPWLASAQTPDALESMSAAYEENAPVRNFVHLFLRVAGAAWVGLEWIAAITLALGYRALRSAFSGAEDAA
jgi:hypothetical protein